MRKDYYKGMKKNMRMFTLIYSGIMYPLQLTVVVFPLLALKTYEQQYHLAGSVLFTFCVERFCLLILNCFVFLLPVIFYREDKLKLSTPALSSDDDSAKRKLLAVQYLEKM